MSQYLGDISAYALAVSQGYTGTEEEYAELMASYATVGQTAVTAAQTATTKASEAATSATTATNKASEATTAATTATTKAGEASTSASTATSAKDTAVSASQTATTKASEATTAAATATSAKTDAVAANTAAQSAKTAAQTAQTGAETAAASVQSSAAQIQTNADDISELKEDLTHAFPHDTVSGAVASFADGADDVPMDSVIVSIDPVQEGSGDPSPDNVRPISGWSEVNVEHTGKNLFNKASVQNSKWLSTTTGEAENATASYCVSEYIPVKANEPVHIPNTASSRRWFYDATKTPKTYLSNSSTQTFTPTEDGFIRVTVNIDQSEGVSIDAVQIEYGSSATAYEPYSGQSINIPLGQTVYGGKLDVTNGVLTVDRILFNMTSIQADAINNIDANGKSFIFLAPVKAISYVATENGIISNRYKGGNYTAEFNDSVFMPNASLLSIKSSTVIGATASEIVEYFTTHDTVVSYKIETPTTISLTPHEVTALLGSNNVWADSGDSAVEYRADPTLYIQRLTEPDADMVADSNITSGSYFMVGNTLYKATANIASGGAITPNVNCTRKSLSEALNEINA